jgi:hypothetical protein
MPYAEVRNQSDMQDKMMQSLFGPQQTQPQANPISNAYGLYNTAVGQQAGDYDNIMGGYKSLFQNLQAPDAVKQITPQTHSYTPSADVTRSMGNLSELSRTGGYTPEGIQDLRARAISPIRSIYAGANRDVDRQRRLQGGFSPNYSAVKAKMARELSDSIGNQMTNVNAGLAQAIAGNRLQAAPQYAGAAAGESGLANQIGMRNADIINDTNRFNIGRSDQNLNQMLQTLSGMQSLYGTTPALAQLFGSQALQGKGLQANINQADQGMNLNLIRSIMAGMR